MIEKNHPGLSIRRQAELLDINRNRLSAPPAPSEEDPAVMRDLDELHLRWPFFMGSASCGGSSVTESDLQETPSLLD